MNLNTSPDAEIISQRLLHFSKKQVFEAFENPNHLMKWWGPNGFTNTFNEFDFKVGGKWSFNMHGSNNDSYPNECEFTQIEKPNLIAWKRFTNPLFQMVLLFEAIETNKTNFIFKMLFENAEECKKLKTFIVEKNEENFDRLEVELQKSTII